MVLTPVALLDLPIPPLLLLESHRISESSGTAPLPFRDCSNQLRSSSTNRKTYPVLVNPRPPKMFTASSAISPANRVDCILRKAICPAKFLDCSLYDCKLAFPPFPFGLKGAHHVAHLISDVLEPCLLSFTLGDHVCESDIRLCIGVLEGGLTSA
jgi:hypothetical protein